MADFEWKFAKASQACCLCQASLAEGPGQPYYSALFVEAATQGQKFSRRDYCVRCFQGGPPADVFYFWKAALPEAATPLAGAKQRAQARRPVVDPEYVLEFFKRLEGPPPAPAPPREGVGGGAEQDAGAAQRLVFRYVLALMLARKKVLVFEGKAATPLPGAGALGGAIHIFREKRGGERHEVREPALSPEAIAAASAELGVLLGVTPPEERVQTEAGAVGPVAPEGTTRRTTA